MVNLDSAYTNAIEKEIGGIESTVDTHMSEIYLGGDQVVKTFKPIDLGFVDMQPLEKRKVSAVKTAEIDAVYSPDLNTKVGTLILSDGKYSIVEGVLEESMLKPTETIEDYVIVMRRFDSSTELKEFYRNGDVTEDYAVQIGNLLAGAHKKANTNSKISRIGFDAVLGNFDEALGITGEFIGTSISEDVYHDIEESYRKFVENNAEFLEERRNSGHIKQCHGDAHSGNMFVEDGIVKIFDGIGFKDEFSYMDTVSDFAFAYMDALYYGQERLAEAMKASYVEVSGDQEGVEKLLDFYVSYRAFVRGEVTTMAALNSPEDIKPELIQEAQKYFDISHEHALKSAVSLCV